MERVGRCPVTGGLATRMGLAGFKDLCLRKRRARVGFIRSKYTRGEFRDPFNTIEYRRCVWCKGERRNWPEELALINIKPEEIEMGSKGQCTICGAKAEVRNTRGNMVCATCQKIVGYVDNHPERIKLAAKLLGKEAEFAAVEVDPVKDKAAAAWNALMDRARDVGFADIADGDPAVMAGTYIVAVDEVMRERDRLKTELDGVRFQLNNAQATIADLEKASSDADDRPLGEKALDGALLNWAREQMEGGKLSLYVVEAKGEPVAA